MRPIGGVLLISGLVWAIAGCGESSVVPLAGGAARGLVLTDSVTDQRFNVAVSNGVLALTDVGGTGTVLPDSGLIDQATGIRYSLAVTRGALTLAPSLNVTGGTSEIELSDTVTTKTYALAVAGGTLTLNPG